MLVFMLRVYIRLRFFLGVQYRQAMLDESKRFMLHKMKEEGLEPPAEDILNKVVQGMVDGMPGHVLAGLALKDGYKPNKDTEPAFMVFNSEKAKVIN